MEMDPNKLAQILEVVIPLIFFGLLPVFFIILVVIHLRLKGLGGLVRKIPDLLDELNARLEDAYTLQIEYEKQAEESDKKILSGIADVGSRNDLLKSLEERLDSISKNILAFVAIAQNQETQYIKALENSLVQMQGRMEEILGLMKDKSPCDEIKAQVAEMAMEAKYHRGDMRDLAAQMEHGQSLNRKKLDELATELTMRIEELADRGEALSANTMETYMKEILNHLIGVQEEILEVSQKLKQ